MEFEEADRHERYLSEFDKAGISVFLQVEPANADMATLIDLVLGRYKRHRSVIGFGVDVEWNRTSDHPENRDGRGRRQRPGLGRKGQVPQPRLPAVPEALGQKMDAADLSRGNRLVDDSQIFPGMEPMIKEFAESWAPAFYPNLVFFQIGYNSDKPWWSKLPDPPKAIGEAIRKRVRQEMGIIWVDFSVREVLPLKEAYIPGPEVQPCPTSSPSSWRGGRAAGCTR